MYFLKLANLEIFILVQYLDKITTSLFLYSMISGSSISYTIRNVLVSEAESGQLGGEWEWLQLQTLGQVTMTTGVTWLPPSNHLTNMWNVSVWLMVTQGWASHLTSPHQPATQPPMYDSLGFSSNEPLKMNLKVCRSVYQWIQSS